MMNNTEYESVIKRTQAQGVRGNCTRCLQDPCSCVSKDILTSYQGVVYEKRTKQQKKKKNSKSA